jgi:hypothetical protein
MPHICRACGLPLVQADCLVAEGDRWRVALRCPSCGWSARELFDAPTMGRFDEEFERGTEELMATLAVVTTHNMHDYLDRFAAALASDAILPGDF